MQSTEDNSLKLLSVGAEKLYDVEIPKYQLMDEFEFEPTEITSFISLFDKLIRHLKVY